MDFMGPGAAPYDSPVPDSPVVMSFEVVNVPR